jgi:hypothetical protein
MKEVGGFTTLPPELPDVAETEIDHGNQPHRLH